METQKEFYSSLENVYSIGDFGWFVYEKDKIRGERVIQLDSNLEIFCEYRFSKVFGFLKV